MKLTEQELNYIFLVLKVHKEGCVDFLGGFHPEKSEEHIFISKLIKKIDEKNF